MTVIDNILQTEGRDKFLRSFGNSSAKVGQKLVKKILERSRSVLEIKTKLGSAAVSKNPKDVLSTVPDVKSLHHFGKELCLRIFCIS